DCQVRGPVAPLARMLEADVAIGIKPRNVKPPRISISASSRVVVFRPTERARAFAAEWQRQCASPSNILADDERCLGWAFLLHPGACEHIAPEYAGREADL